VPIARHGAYFGGKVNSNVIARRARTWSFNKIDYARRTSHVKFTSHCVVSFASLVRLWRFAAELALDSFLCDARRKREKFSSKDIRGYLRIGRGIPEIL